MRTREAAPCQAAFLSRPFALAAQLRCDGAHRRSRTRVPSTREPFQGTDVNEGHSCPRAPSVVLRISCTALPLACQFKRNTLIRGQIEFFSNLSPLFHPCRNQRPNRLRLVRRCARIHIAAQHFGHAPRLGAASPWCERRLGIEDLADRPCAGRL
jgi:hypothetical protein